MKKYFVVILFMLCVLSVVSCGSGANPGQYSSVNQVVVDSTNDRLFLSQPGQELFVLEASTQENIGDQPVVKEDRQEAIHDLLPYSVSHMAVTASGTVSRLFILGGLVQSDRVKLNQILVLDFDGEDFSEASFSPISISDGDGATDETANSFADMLVDEDAGVLYVTDATAGVLYGYDVTDGTEVLNQNIAGYPTQMALDTGYLYVCNASDVEAEQVITVMNTTDNTVTNIELNAPCGSLAVQTGDEGTVLLVRRLDSQMIRIVTVDTITHDAITAVAAAESSYHDGYVSAGHGISSAADQVFLVKDDSGDIKGYYSELDGILHVVSFSADLASYEVERLTTSATNLTNAAALLNAQGEAGFVFFTAETGALAVVDVADTSVEMKD